VQAEREGYIEIYYVVVLKSGLGLESAFLLGLVSISDKEDFELSV